MNPRVSSGIRGFFLVALGAAAAVITSGGDFLLDRGERFLRGPHARPSSGPRPDSTPAGEDVSARILAAALVGGFAAEPDLSPEWGEDPAGIFSEIVGDSSSPEPGACACEESSDASGVCPCCERVPENDTPKTAPATVSAAFRVSTPELSARCRFEPLIGTRKRQALCSHVRTRTAPAEI